MSGGTKKKLEKKPGVNKTPTATIDRKRELQFIRQAVIDSMVEVLDKKIKHMIKVGENINQAVKTEIRQSVDRNLEQRLINNMPGYKEQLEEYSSQINAEKNISKRRLIEKNRDTYKKSKRDEERPKYTRELTIEYQQKEAQRIREQCIEQLKKLLEDLNEKFNNHDGDFYKNINKSIDMICNFWLLRKDSGNEALKQATTGKFLQSVAEGYNSSHSKVYSELKKIQTELFGGEHLIPINFIEFKDKILGRLKDLNEQSSVAEEGWPFDAFDDLIEQLKQDAEQQRYDHRHSPAPSLTPVAELKLKTNKAIVDLQQQMEQVLQQETLEDPRISDDRIPIIHIKIQEILENLQVDDEHLEAVEVTIILQNLQQSMDDLNNRLASDNPDVEDIVMMLDDISATLAELAEGKHWGQQLEATILDDDQDDLPAEQLQPKPVLQEEISIEEREKRFLKQISRQGIVFYTSKMIEQQCLTLNIEAIKGDFEAKFQEVFNLQQSELQAKDTISELAKKIFLLTNLGCEKKEILRLTQFKSISSGKFLGDSDDIRREQLRLEKEQAFCQLKHVKQRLNLTVDDQGELFELLQPGGKYYKEIEAQLAKEKQDRSAGSALQEKYQSILIKELSAMYGITPDADTTIQNVIERVQKTPLIRRINGSIEYLGSISQLLSFFDGNEYHTRDKESRQKDPYVYKEELEELWHPTLVDKPIAEFKTTEALQHYQLGILEQIQLEDARLLELRSQKLSTLPAIEQAIEQKECNLDIQALESLAKKLQDEIDRKRIIEAEKEQLQFNGQVDQLSKDEFKVRNTIKKEQKQLFEDLDDISQQLNLMQEKYDRFQSKLLSLEVKARGHLIDNEDLRRKEIEQIHRELLEKMQAQSELLDHEKTARQDITKNQRKAIKKLKLEWDKLQAQRNFLGDETTTRQNLFEKEETSRQAIQAPIQAQLDKIQAEEQAAKINEQHLIDAIVAEIINVVQEANQLRDKKYSAAPQVVNKAKEPAPSMWSVTSWAIKKGLQMTGIVSSKDTPTQPQNNQAALEEISKNLLKLSNDLPHRLSNIKF